MSPKMLFRRISVSLVAAGLLAVTSCGGNAADVYPVSGTARYAGEPLAGFVIFFRPAQGPLARAVIDAEGHYALETAGVGPGAVAGRHQVFFAPPDKQFTMDADAVERSPSPPETQPTREIPIRFLSHTTSGLTAQVEAGPNTLDWNLQAE